MPSKRSGLGCLFSNLLCAAVCLPLLLSLMPELEENRDEVRRMQTHSDVVHLSMKLAGKELPANVHIERDEVDFWETPYRIMDLGAGRFRVVSAGRDKLFWPEGADDDIASDMPVSPSEMIQSQKSRQWLIAFGATALVWGIVLAAQRSLWGASHRGSGIRPQSGGSQACSADGN